MTLGGVERARPARCAAVVELRCEELALGAGGVQLVAYILQRATRQRASPTFWLYVRAGLLLPSVDVTRDSEGGCGIGRER